MLLSIHCLRKGRHNIRVKVRVIIPRDTQGLTTAQAQGSLTGVLLKILIFFTGDIYICRIRGYIRARRKRAGEVRERGVVQVQELTHYPDRTYTFLADTNNMMQVVLPRYTQEWIDKGREFECI